MAGSNSWKETVKVKLILARVKGLRDSLGQPLKLRLFLQGLRGFKGETEGGGGVGSRHSLVQPLKLSLFLQVLKGKGPPLSSLKPARITLTMGGGQDTVLCDRLAVCTCSSTIGKIKFRKDFYVRNWKNFHDQTTAVRETSLSGHHGSPNEGPPETPRIITILSF